MIAIELLKAMSPQHAINTLRADFDPLTSTPLERFLVDWLETLLDEAAENEELLSAVKNSNLDAQEIQALAGAVIDGNVDNTVRMLDMIADYQYADELRGALDLVGVLDDHGIEAPEDLRQILDLTAQFRALTNDAGDVFSRFTQLITTVQE